MVDKVTPTKRSTIMAMVKNKDTKPELVVRQRVFAAGFRYRLHVRKLPGTPDLVFPRYHRAVFIHGCFWHGHDCPKGKLPATNRDFWQEKILKNIDRDRQAVEDLERDGWQVATIWSCRIEEGVEDLLALLTKRRETS